MIEPGASSTVATPISRRRLGAYAAAGLAIAAGLGYGASRLASSHLTVRLGIAPGTQTLWRYVAGRKDDLLTPLGYTTEFVPYGDEPTLRSAFNNGKVDVIASLVPTVASLSESGVAAQLFLPIAWMREGFPWVVPADSGIDRLAALRGRRVGTYPLDHPGMLYWRALTPAIAGFDLSTLNPTETLSPDTLLTSRGVEAACVGGVQWSNLQHGTGYRKLIDLQSAWQTIAGGNRLLLFGGYIARRDFLDANPTFVADFVKVHSAALDAYKKDRAGFLDASAASPAGPPMTASQNQDQATYLGYDDVDSGRLVIDDQDIADHRKLFDLMAKANVLKSPPPDASTLLRPVKIT